MAYSKKPNDIPTTPNLVYAKEGRTNWPDWLGTDTRSGAEIVWRPFEEARAFARSLGLKSGKEWVAFGKTDKRPADIPTAPYRIYAKDGWTNWKIAIGDSDLLKSDIPRGPRSAKSAYQRYSLHQQCTFLRAPLLSFIT